MTELESLGSMAGVSAVTVLAVGVVKQNMPTARGVVLMVAGAIVAGVASYIGAGLSGNVDWFRIAGNALFGWLAAMGGVHATQTVREAQGKR